MHRYIALIATLLALGGCSNYPPIDSYLSFNVAHTVAFGVPTAVGLNKDTTLTASAHIDTITDYTKNQTSAYLLRTSEVWRVYLESNDPNYTLDNLAYARILIGADTVAIDTLPQGALDLNFELTKKDVTQYLRDTSFTTSLECKFLSAPPNATSLQCGITIVHTALAKY